MDIRLVGAFLAITMIGAGLLAAGLKTRRMRRKRARALLGGAGALGLVLVVGIAVFINGSVADQNIAIDGKNGNHFALQVKHTRVSMDGSEYRFRPGVPEHELRQLFIAQFPDGEVEGERFSVILNGLRFVVEPDDEDGVWAAYRQTVTLIDQDGYITNVSFPTGVVEDDQLRFDEPTPLLIERQEVFDELAQLGTPVAEDGTVYAGTVNQGVIHMTFTADTVTVNRL